MNERTVTIYDRVQMQFTVPALTMANGLASCTDEAGKAAFAAKIKELALLMLAADNLRYGMVNTRVVSDAWGGARGLSASSNLTE